MTSARDEVTIFTWIKSVKVALDEADGYLALDEHIHGLEELQDDIDQRLDRLRVMVVE
jgi:hypothetical protein